MSTQWKWEESLQKLIAKYYKVVNEAVRATMRRMVNYSMIYGQDSGDSFVEKTLVRPELEKMGESMSDRKFKDIFAQGFTADYKAIKPTMYRDPTFDISNTCTPYGPCNWTTTCHRNGGALAVRGIVMSLETQICYN